MPPRSLLSTRARAELFDIPTDPDGLMRHYLLSPSDRELIRTRRRDENRFGLAVRISLLRYPGQGWRDGVVLPAALLDWLGDQLHLSASHLLNYASRGATRATQPIIKATPHLKSIWRDESVDRKPVIATPAQAKPLSFASM